MRCCGGAAASSWRSIPAPIPSTSTLDLGNALRLATIDFDINVRFVAPIIKGKRDLDAAGAYARIIYPDAPDGHLLYLKPWLPQALPADVLAYFSAHADFPHQTTANQFFSESQFESYRALGELIVSNAFGGANKLDDMVVAAERAAARQRAATAATAPRWQRKPPRSTPPRRE